METEEFYDELESSENEENSEGSIIEALEGESTEFPKRKYYDESEDSHKRQKFDSVQPPTVQELNQLRETENLFNSSLFRMQIEEMLKEIQMKTKYQKLFQEWFNQFKSFLFGLKNSEIFDLTDESWLENFAVKPPVCLKPATEQGMFRFIPPENITVGGSFSIQACLGPLHNIDVHIHIPKDVFHRSDQINFRFNRKRAFYLTVLADALIDSSLVEEAHFVQADEYMMKPLLQLKPSGKVGHHIRVILRLVTSSDVLLLNRLRPGRGNIRSQWFLGYPISEKNADSDPPSPHYNCGMAQDIVWRQNQEMMEAELSTPSLQAGLILLKVWLRQRRLDKGYGSFGGFIMSMYLVYLLQNKRINKMMSSYQVARITWNCLSQSDWTKNGISLSSASKSPPISDFHKHFEVVFVDVSGYCNLCANIRKEIYMQVKSASAEAVILLDTSSKSFHSLFMVPVEFLYTYDHIIRFQCAPYLLQCVKERSTPEQQLALGGWMLPLLLTLVLSRLEEGLGDRVLSIGFLPPKVGQWACCDQPPSPSSISVPLLVGLRLNSTEVNDAVLRGPEADQPEAKAFRSFWGKLSELRRFQDGRICEAIIWKGRISPCEQMVCYVLNQHVGLTKNHYVYLPNFVDVVLRRRYVQQIFTSGNEVRVILRSFDTLLKQLRALPDMTLSVNTVQGISPLFRYADVFPPLAVLHKKNISKCLAVQAENSFVRSSLLSPISSEDPVPHYIPPIEAVMTLELSGKWPRNLEAVRRLKAAFCLQLAKVVQEKCEHPSQAHVDHVDIYKDGFVFRIWLAALKEVSLMKQKVDALGVMSYHDTPQTIALEEKLVMLPKLSSSLHGLHQQFPNFGPTACIVKRWVSSQLLGSPYIPDLVIELLVAYCFLSPEPFHPPAQSQLGLIHFLRLVSSTDWLTVPIIVNLNAELSRERIAELETQFHSSRDKFPSLFLVTPYDHSISQTTRTAPTLQMLIRLGSLALAALGKLQMFFISSNHFNILDIFRPNFEEYDVIIKLSAALNSRLEETLDTEVVQRRQIAFYTPIMNEEVPVVDFDPIQCYLTELREGYSFCALFFHDQYGGNNIGVVWKPSITQEQDFKSSIINGQKPTHKSKISMNISAILEDFYFIGRGLVKGIVNRTRHGMCVDE